MLSVFRKWRATQFAFAKWILKARRQGFEAYEPECVRQGCPGRWERDRVLEDQTKVSRSLPWFP